MNPPAADEGLAYLTFPSPLGELSLISSASAIVQLSFSALDPPPKPVTLGPAAALAAEARRQVDAFLAGHRRLFDLPLEPRGTAFQLAVWNAMLTIEYGKTRSYGEVARTIGANAGASRAVGLACGQNPIPLIIPCHRVVASGGRLGGFGGGLDRKRFLLHLERLGKPPRAVPQTAPAEKTGTPRQLSFDL